MRCFCALPFSKRPKKIVNETFILVSYMFEEFSSFLLFELHHVFNGCKISPLQRNPESRMDNLIDLETRAQVENLISNGKIREEEESLLQGNVKDV